MSILGTRVLRTEDPRFLTSGGVYTEDVVDERLDGACHVFFVRSPLAHARIAGVDVSAALSAPGVIAAYTGADLAALPLITPGLNKQMSRRVLATDKIRFVGEPLAPRFGLPGSYPHTSARPMRLESVRQVGAVAVLHYRLTGRARPF